MSLGQTIYTENMGTTASGNPVITAYTGWQNGAPIVYTGTADARTTSVSSGYTGASGSVNIFINAVDEFFQIDGINTSAYNTADLQLSFGINTPTNVTNVLIVEVSTNGGTTWTPLTYTPSATGWTLATITSGIPSTATLSIRFKSSSTLQYRIDDVKVANVSASCTLSLGTPTTACDASTLGTDTYTVTIPYTGGGNAAYVITPNMGTVGGDNPTTVAAGNITVSGITEGTAFSATVTGGTCNLSATANSPECEPANPLPYAEAFPYAAGTSLGSTQKWTNVNTGDNITTASGSLVYPGFTTSGNSVTFGADGIDCFTPIASTTSGTVYYSYLLNIASMAGVTDVNGGYITGLGSSTTTLGATLWTKRVDDTSFNIGLEVRTANAANTTYTATAYQTGTTYFIVVGYTFGAGAGDDTVSLWVNPVLNGAQPAATLTDAHAATDLASVDYFFLRQDSTSETPATVQVDELRVGTNWTDVSTSALSVAQNEIAGLNIYPNPVSNDVFFIETALNLEKNIVIYDILGKQVLNTTTTSTEVNVGGLNNGIYLVKITEEGKTAVKKLVIR